MKVLPQRRPWLRRLLWLALVGVSVVGALRSDAASRLAARSVERVAEALIGEQVTIGRVHVGFFPPEVSVQGLMITHPATGATIVAARAVTLTLGQERGRPRLRRLAIERPMVELHVDEDGLREFRALTGGSSSDEPPGELPWRDLAVTDGTFLLHTPDVGVSVGGINLTPRREAGVGDLTIDRVELDLPQNDQVATALTFPGVRLGADRVEIPTFDIQFPAFGVDGGVSIPTAGPMAGDVSLRLELAKLTATTEPMGTWIDGVVQVDATLGGTLAAPDVTGALGVTGFSYWRPFEGHMEALSFGDTFGAWTLAPSPTGPRFALHHAKMRWGPGTLDIDAQAGIEDHSLAGTVTAEGVSLADILRSVAVAPTPWVDFTGDVETHVTGEWSPFHLEGPFEVDLTELEVGDGPVHRPHETLLHIPRGVVAGQLRIDTDHMVLDCDTVRAGPSHGRAVADIGFGSQGPLRIDASLPQVDLSWLAPLGDIELDGLAEIQATLQGPYDALGVDGVVNARSFVVLGLPMADTLTAHVTSDMERLEFDGIEAMVGETRWTGRYLIDFERDEWMEAEIAIPDGRLRDLTGIFTDLGDLDGRAAGAMTLIGTPYNLSGETRLTLADVNLYGERFPTGEALGWMDDGELILDHIRVQRPNGDRLATVLARGSVRRDWKMNVEVLSDGLTLDHLDLLAEAGLPLEGDVTLDARVGGTLFDWRPRGRVAVRHTRYGGEPLADTTLTFDTVDLAPGEPGLSWSGTVLGKAGRVAGNLGFYGAQPYTLQAELDAFPLHFFYPRGLDGSPIEATVTGSLDLRGQFGDSPTPVDIVGNLTGVRLAWSGHELTNQDGRPWKFSVHQKSVDIPRLTLAGNDDTVLSLEGTVGAGGRVQLTGGGTVNLDLARAVTPGLTEANGLANVRFEMTPANVGSDVLVTADLLGPTLRTEYWPDPLENVRGHIEARPTGYTFTGVEATVGGGAFVGKPSRIDADGWTPTRYALAASVDDIRTRYLDYLPPIQGDADLTFEGPADDPLLAGTIRIDDMQFRDRIDWEAMVISLREERLTAAAPEASERYFGMDLQITAADTAHFRNNVADADASADLRIVGDTARPGMVGTIRLDPGGRVYLHEREFEVSRGEIRYLDPYTFDPDLDVLLETDVRSQEQDYHVTYGVTGPFSDWRTQTNADPFLSQADINALLLFGVTREELERYGGQALGTALVAETGDLLLGQTALTRANPIIDRWSLVSGVTERGSTTVSSDLRLVAEKQLGDFDLTLEASLGQNIGQDWYASVERRIARRVYATAYAATRQEGRSLPIGAAYGAEFKLRWEMD